MLNWWMGKAPQGNRVQDERSELLEPPETPAPVFAARALKSAIFGPPARLDDTIYEDDTADVGEDKIPDSRSMSPTKPSGILLTPGTANTRRKTVSFDNDVVDKAGKGPVTKPASKSGLPDDFPGKFPSPWVAKSDRKPRIKTNLTKTLENSREKPAKSRKDVKASASEHEFDVGEPLEPAVVLDIGTSKEARRGQNIQKPPHKSDDNNTMESNMTVDLDEPRSKSGIFWKTEFEHYHVEAKAEMRKLVEYKNMARSYARTKDEEAIDLAAKLQEEQTKVMEMERKISRLSARIGQAGRDGESEEDSPALVKELARQTALALQYRSQVEEFRLALEEHGIEAKGSIEIDRKNILSPRTERTILDTHHELKKAREQLRDMAALKQEAKKLREENTKLTQEILHADLRLEKHLEKCDKKSRQNDEQRAKREEAMQSLQNDYEQLKETSKARRRELENQLTKRNEQVVSLRKEIASVRGSDETVQELRKALETKTLEHGRVVEGYKKQLQDLVIGQTSQKVNPPSLSQEVASSDNRLLLATQNISRPLKAFASKLPVAEDSYNTPRQRASYPALSEIVNNANKDTLPPPRYGPVQHTPIAPITPLSDSFSNTSWKSPELDLPSFEASIKPEPIRGTHARNCHASPRPSIFNIASSPPKAALMRGHTTNEVTRQRSQNDLRSHRSVNMNSSQLPTGDTPKPVKVALPPERIAAAKARLEAKQAERKRARGAGKENIKV